MKCLLAREFEAAPEVLAEVRAEVAAACRLAGCDAAVAEQAVLAVNEACMNVIQHGYRGESGRLRLECGVDAGMLVLRVLDNARPVGAADLRPRPLDELRPGGLGVHFIRAAVDAFEYLPPPPGYVNLLEMRRAIRREPNGDADSG